MKKVTTMCYLSSSPNGLRPEPNFTGFKELSALPDNYGH